MPGFFAFGDGALGDDGAHDPILDVINETIATTGATTEELRFVIYEQLALVSAAVPLANRTALLADSLGMTARVSEVFIATILDSIALDDDAGHDSSVLVALIDTLVMTGTATGTMRALEIIAETLALASVATSIQQGAISDTADFTEALTNRYSAYEELVANLLFSDTATGIALFTVLVTDALDFDDTITPIAHLAAAIHEELEFSVSFDLGDTVYVAYSMNAATKGLTTYTNFGFTSMFNFGGYTYGTTAAGLYRLGGTTDAGAEIAWRIRTGLTNFGTGKNKGLDAAYLGYTATGRVVLKCIVVAPGSGGKIVHLYELTTPNAGAAHSGRIMTGRGLKSVYWAFELTNITAGTIDLDTIEFHPVVFEGRLP